jgi:Tol biopolymer transport system component
MLAASILATLMLLAPAQAEVDRRLANSGNVVLEDVPEIPADIREALSRYQNTRSAGLAGWSADGESIYISTRFAEVNQLHRVDRPGGARHQLTWFDEPIGSVARRPGHATMAFLMDEGGSEFSQIFLFDPADASHRMISDGESRNQGLAWSDDGRLLAFTSTRRDGRSNDIWLFDFASGSEQPKLVLQAPDGSAWAAADFSPDGKHLLVQQYISINDARIHLLDLESGALTLLAGGGDAPSANFAQAFSADGRSVFFGTDAGSEFTQLARLDLDDRARVAILTPDIAWSVQGLALNHARDAGVFSVNEGGINRLYRLDPASGSHSRIDGIPEGLIGGVEFSPDDSKLGLVVNNARSPSDVYVMAWNAGELERWTWS